MLEGGKKVYRVIRGVSGEPIDKDEALVSYSTFKSLGAKSGDRVIIKSSTFLERNFCFNYEILIQVSGVV
jgi:hypothetical protein